jgi:hypothetical protein
MISVKNKQLFEDEVFIITVLGWDDWWKEGDSFHCVDLKYENLTKCQNLPLYDISG